MVPIGINSLLHVGEGTSKDLIKYDPKGEQVMATQTKTDKKIIPAHTDVHPNGLSIAMVTDDFFPAHTGAGVHVQKVAQELVRRGHRVVVLTSRRAGQGPLEDWHGVKVRRFFSVPICGMAQTLPTQAAIRQVLTEEKVDIVHHHYLGFMMIQATAVARSLGLPMVYTAHMSVEILTQPFFMKPFHGLLIWIHRRLCRQMDRIICVSAQQVPEIRPINPAVQVLTNPIDFTGDEAREMPRTAPFVVLYVGRMTPEKNVGYLLRGFKLLADRRAGTELWIAGQGVLEPNLRREAGRLGITDPVKFLGHVSHDRLPDLYAAADVFVLPSVLETQGMVVLEAMRFRRPVIVTNRIISARELVEEGENGFIVDSDSDQDLADKLMRLYDDPALRRRMGEAGFSRFPRATTADVGDRLEKLYLGQLFVGNEVPHSGLNDSSGIQTEVNPHPPVSLEDRTDSKKGLTLPLHSSYRAVVLSPHWDDAVFSAGGRMAQLAREGRVLVVNFFTHSSKNHVPSLGVSPDRLQEERAAMSLLGFESVTLAEDDAPEREKEYQSISRLFGDLVPADRVRLPRLAARLKTLLSSITFDILYVPLAVGWHVDHQMTFLAARDWWRDPQVLFYEDMPYALLPRLTDYRLREIGRVDGSAPDGWIKDFRHTMRGLNTMKLIQKFVPPIRWVASAVTSIFLAKQMKTHRTRWITNGPRLVPESVDISGTFDLKMEAVSRYHSQSKIFFHDRQDWRARQHTKGVSVIERFWKMEPDLASQRAETIPDILRHCSQERPLDSALWYQRQGHWVSLSWKDYWAQVERLAGTLDRLGLKAGEKIAVILPTSVEWELIDKAALCLGLVVVGIEPHMAWDSMVDVIKKTQPTAVITPTRELAFKIKDLEERPFKLLVTMEKGPGDLPVVPWDILRWQADQGPMFQEPFVVAPSSPATYLLTSGTTGTPKGIVYSHEQLLYAARSILAAMGPFQKDDRVFAWLPMANLFQKNVNLAALLAGIPLYFWSDPKTIFEALPQVRPTILIGVPRVFEKFYLTVLDRLAPWLNAFLEKAMAVVPKSSGGGKNRSVGEWVFLSLLRWVFAPVRKKLGGRMRFMVTGSAPCREDVLLFFHAIGIPLLEAYGTSECVVPISMNRPEDYKIGTVGKPLAQNTFFLEDDGEIEMEGPGVFKGYENAPAQTNLTSGKYLSTGDIGRLDSEGYLTLVGRKNDFIKTSTGRKVAPTAIEQKLQMALGAEQVLVVGHARPCLAAIVCFNGLRTPEQIATVRWALAKTNEGLAPYEQVRGCLVFDRPFFMETGELTRNFKLCRFQIEQRHASSLNTLFNQIQRNLTDPKRIGEFWIVLPYTSSNSSVRSRISTNDSG